jgi:hypothetical protein
MYIESEGNKMVKFEVYNEMVFYWCNGWNIEDLKNLILNDYNGIKEGVDICMIEDKNNLQSAYLSVYDNKLWLTLNKHNREDFDNDYENVKAIEIKNSDIISLDFNNGIKQFMYEKFLEMKK